MKREEAIYKAKHLRKVHPSICIDSEDFWETVITTLEQEPKWIPISKRLPDDRKKYLVTFKGGNVGIMYYASDLYRVDEYDFCDEKGKAGWYDYDRELGHYSRDDVIAWMSLPTPYKAESEDKE